MKIVVSDSIEPGMKIKADKLELVRCGNHADDERDRYNGLFRQLWPIWLDGSSNELSGTYKVESEFYETALKIIKEADFAETLCSEMAACNPLSENSYKKIEQLSVDLNRTDHRLKELTLVQKCITEYSGLSDD